MAHLSLLQIEENMLGNGFPFAALRDGMAIILAESGGDTTAVNHASGDYGTWQINRIHFGDGVINSGNWQNQGVQFHEAARLSGNGSNWAAWCTAWAHPGGNCGHGYLPHIQAGSAAYYNLTEVDTYLRSLPGIPRSGPAPTAHSNVTSAWSNMQHYASTGAPGHYSTLNGIQNAIARLRR